MSDASLNPDSIDDLSVAFAADGEKPPDEPGKPLISFNHVSISFGDRAVLDDVSFTVERGQTLCILGRSGVGKSVTLRLLMGFLKPDSGVDPDGERGDHPDSTRKACARSASG